MIDQETIAFARARFERQGIEGLAELANSSEYRVACVRIFLKTWTECLNDIDNWAKQLIESCELLLPISVSHSWAPELYEEIEVFSKTFAKEIQEQVTQHPDHFSLPTISTVTMKNAIAEFYADRKNKVALRISEDWQLEIAKDLLVRLLKQAIKEDGLDVSNFSRCDLMRTARRILPKNPHVYEEINNILHPASND